MYPTIGRIVHFASTPGSPWVPAIITKIFGPSCVDLCVFDSDNEKTEWHRGVLSQDACSATGPRWCWPPRGETG